jgi:hypothetical protein
MKILAKHVAAQAITARFTDKPVKLDDAEEPRVLTTLKMIYEGGSLDGKIADLPTRDLSSLASTVVIGISLRLTSARSGSTFAMGERSFASPAARLNPTTAGGGTACSRSFTSVS